MNLKRIIREEIEEFKWMTMSGEPAELIVGERIRVYNIGNEESYEKWLGVFKDSYLAGDYGPNITGEIVDLEFFPKESPERLKMGLKLRFIDLEEEKTKERIYLPSYETLEIENKENGLNLFYQKL